jgi:2Fe-2S ferredoxin
VDDAFIGLLPPPDDMESALLEAVASERRPGSRLSCQLTVTAAFDGLTVHVPDTQV